MAAADVTEAELLGVAPSVIVALRREMERGVHWDQEGGPSGRVWFTDAGRAWIRARLDGSEKKEGGGLLQTWSAAFTIWTEEKREAADCLLVIVKCAANSNVVLVRTPEGARAKVLVRSNAKLRPRLKLRCCLLPDGQWECRQPGLAVKAKPLAREVATP